MSVEKVTGEVIDKSHGEILEEIRHKLEKLNTRDYPMFSKFQNKDLIVLVPKKYYDTLICAMEFDFFAKNLHQDKVFGVKIEVAEVSKIYVAYDGD